MNDIVVEPIELEETSFDDVTNEPLIKRNLALLGHVNVRLEVMVGSAEMSVDRLFSLGKGESIVLDTQLDAPVTLQLDGKPIARGQLVAVGDNFGLKVTEIL